MRPIRHRFAGPLHRQIVSELFGGLHHLPSKVRIRRLNDKIIAALLGTQRDKPQDGQSEASQKRSRNLLD
jgi:hypothetical protein